MLPVLTIEVGKERLIPQKLGSPRLQRENIKLQMVLMIKRKIIYNKSIVKQQGFYATLAYIRHSGQFRDQKSLDLHEKSLDLSN